MLDMAWGGEDMYEQTTSDLRLANMLWSEAHRRVILIDFEKSKTWSNKRPIEPLEVLHELSDDYVSLNQDIEACVNTFKMPPDLQSAPAMDRRIF